MKNKIFILSSLIAIFSVAPAFSSECIGDGCDIEPIVSENDGSVTDFEYDNSCVMDAPISAVCPFETDAECAIWLRKPMVNESVSPHSPHMYSIVMQSLIDAAGYDPEISANEYTMMPLLKRYKLLQQSANVCCRNGFAYHMQKRDMSGGEIYKFMVDDANFYGFGARCLMMDDQEIDKIFPHKADGIIASDVRNTCLCKSRDWYRALLAPFSTLYNAVPEFAQNAFYYTYIDGLGREIKISVNEDVKNVLSQLNACP